MKRPNPAGDAMTTCPTRDHWAQFLDDRLPPADEANLTTHLETCPTCILALENMTAPKNDALTCDVVPSRLQPSSILPATELHRLRQLLAITTPLASGPPIAHHPGAPLIPGYDIERELGRGGMGIVYLARQTQLNRRVALKMILAGQHANQEQVVRFLAEAQTCAALRHENIVQIFEVGQHDRMPFYSMEYVNGGTLAERSQRQPLTPREAAELIEQLARAMHAAHIQGVIHRDLKPVNILLRAPAAGHTVNGSATIPLAGAGLMPKITDFGLAKHFELEGGMTQSGAILGTPDFMAPEQVEPGTRPIGPSVDIHALGAILYYLIAGRPPYAAPTMLETLAQVKQADPVSPSQVNPVVPRDLSIICLRCLEKHPERRYATADALADDLRRFLQGEPITARPVTELERLWKWARRRPAIAALSMALAAMVIVALGLVSWQWYLTDQARSREAQRADDEAKAKRAEAKARYEAQVLSAGFALDQGIQECRAGKIEGGLLSMVRALEMLPPDEPDFEFAIRANLAAWRERLCPVQRGKGHGTAVVSVAYSPDGKTVLTGNWGNTMGHSGPAQVQLWDVDRFNSEPLWTVNHPAGAPSIGFKSKGDHAIAAWSVAFNRQGDRVAVGGFDGTTCVRDAKTGELCFPPLPHTGRVYAVAFSPDGKTLAVGGHASHPVNVREPIFSGGGELRFWDAATGKALGEPQPLPFRIACLAWSPDGKFVALGGLDPDKVGTGTAGVAALFEFMRGKLIEPWMAHGDAVSAVTVHPDGKMLATGCRDGLARFWSLPDCKVQTKAMQHALPVNCVQFSHDGKMLATAAGHHEPGIRSGHGEIRIWDSATAALLVVPHFEPVPTNSQKMHSVAFGKDDRKLAAACENGAAYLWILPQPLAPRFSFPLAGRADILHSPDGKTMLLTVLPPNQLGFAKKPCVIHIIDNSDGRTLGVLPHPVCVVARFSRDGKRIVTIPTSTDLSPNVCMWDAITGTRQPLPEGFGSALRDCHFSTDEKTMTTIAADGTCRRWDVSALTPMGDATACLKSDENLLAINDAGTLLLASGPAGRRLVALPECRTHTFLTSFDVTGDTRILAGRPTSLGFFTADGKSVVTVAHLARHPVEQWSTSDGSRLAAPVDDKFWTVTARQANGNRFLLNLVSGASSRVWDPAAAKLHPAEIPISGTAAIHPAGQYIASTDSGAASHVQLWSIAGKAIGPPLPHPLLHAVEFNPNGRWLVTSSFDKSVKVWPLPTPFQGTPDAFRIILRTCKRRSKSAAAGR